MKKQDWQYVELFDNEYKLTTKEINNEWMEIEN